MLSRHNTHNRHTATNRHNTHNRHNTTNTHNRHNTTNRHNTWCNTSSVGPDQFDVCSDMPGVCVGGGGGGDCLLRDTVVLEKPSLCHF